MQYINYLRTVARLEQRKILLAGAIFGVIIAVLQVFGIIKITHTGLKIGSTQKAYADSVNCTDFGNLPSDWYAQVKSKFATETTNTTSTIVAGWIGTVTLSSGTDTAISNLVSGNGKFVFLEANSTYLASPAFYSFKAQYVGSVTTRDNFAYVAYDVGAGNWSSGNGSAFNHATPGWNENVAFLCGFIIRLGNTAPGTYGSFSTPEKLPYATPLVTATYYLYPQVFRAAPTSGGSTSVDLTPLQDYQHRLAVKLCAGAIALAIAAWVIRFFMWKGND